MRLVPLFLICISIADAQSLVVTPSMHHLRNSQNREWSSFPETAPSYLNVSFDASNGEWETLRIRQKDVRQSWQVLINGKQIGQLVEDEKDITIYLPVPKGLINVGRNSLVVTTSSKQADDILAGEVTLLQQSLDETLSQSVLEIQVNEIGKVARLPSRITILDEKHSMHMIGSNDAKLVVRPGCVYTPDGTARISMPAGIYKIFASRGFEYSADSVVMNLLRGETQTVALSISREVDTRGWVSSDPHVHTYTHSGHGDATDVERVITLAGEGIELPVITDHNLGVNLQEAAASASVEKWFTLVTGNEVTTKVGHFNVFPVPGSPVPNHQVGNWAELSQEFHGFDGAVILNHANDVHNNFTPFDRSRHVSPAGLDREGWPFPANAMEVMNSGSQQTDIMKLFEQWMGMLNGGHVLTPVGSSDSHDVSRYIVGQGRTYIKMNDEDPGKLNVEEAVKSFLDGHVMVSCGLLTKISVGNKYGPGDFAKGKKKIDVHVSVEGPSWSKADHVALYMNGSRIRESAITLSNKITKWEGNWQVDIPSHDVYLVAIATGPGDNIPFWPIEKPYQPASPDWQARLVGATGAVWIDADRNGKRQTASDYAKLIIAESKGDIRRMVKRLASFDPSLSVQVAAQLWQAGVDLNSKEIMDALNTQPKVRDAFMKFVEEVDEH
jgi:hypothetical protein